MTTRLRGCLPAATALCLGVTLAGCSSDDSATNDSSTAAAASSVASSAATSSAADRTAALDLEAHRAGRGEYTEQSRLAFEHALDIGVNTIEFDIVMSADGVPVVWHDPDVQAEKCADTEPATPDDPQFPYVGKDIHDLTFKQISTLRCDLTLEDFPDAQPATDNHLLQLSDVFALTAERGATVNYNIEAKIEADDPERSAPPEEIVDAILHEVEKAGVEDHAIIQSFDWRALPLVKARHPEIRTAALYDDTTWVPGSPWTNGVDPDDVNNDVLQAVADLGADIVSPGYAVPYDTHAGDADFHPTASSDYVARAHELGLKVVPWTVNDEATMEYFIDAGVDGLITDFPTLLRSVMEKRGMELPPAFPA